MKKFSSYFLLIPLVFLISCASQHKSTATLTQMEAFNTMMTTKSFEINATWARPLATRSLNSVANAGLLPYGSTLSRIDLRGTASFLRITEGRAMAQLPYFGEQQMGGPYNPNNAGIQFDGVPKDFELEPNEKEGGYTMRFTINNGVETYQVVSQMFPSLSATFSVSSTHRRAIQYDGTLSEYIRQ